MKSYVRSIDGLNVILKLILGFFLGPILFGIYRIAKGKVLLGVIWIFTAGLFFIGNIIDLITILTKNKITFLI